MEKTITSYKGFNSDLTCRGFQYEVGKEYEIDGDIKCCERGFHACESPLEVLDHYFLDDKAGMKRFAEVEQSGKMDRDLDGSTKVASSKIRIKAELKFADLIKVGIDWLIDKTRPVPGKKCRNNDGGEDYAKIGSSGDSAKIGSSGYYAQIGSSGNSAQIGSSGDSAKIGSSGNSAQIGSSGDYAKIGSSGDYAKIGSSGYSAKIGSSGDYAQIDSTGEDTVVCCAGHGSMIKAKKGSWITLAEWRFDKKKQRSVPLMVKTVQIDGEAYKEDTWYIMRNGEIVEA